jgi:hypothetical protein
MTDNENGKKMAEEVELQQFLDAYRQVTGKRLSLVCAAESPDFICAGSDGRRIGVELTKANGDQSLARWEKILDGSPCFNPFHVLDCIYASVEIKKAKRTAWRFVGDTILVLQFDYYPLSDVEDFLTPDLAKDFAECGFSEIWIADYTTLEAFDDIELFCLKPSQLWGLQNRQLGKPYG